MAIELISHADENEIKVEFPNAYLKIHDVEIRASNGEVWIRILIFANKDAREMSGASSIKKITEKTNIENLNLSDFTKSGLISAAYNYLKTNQKYVGLNV